VQHLPQVDNRFVEWCYFEAYSLKDITKFLVQIHPHFAQLDLKNPAHLEQVEYLYEVLGGLPGLIIPFLKKLNHYQREEPEEITVNYLRVIHLRTVLEKQQSVDKSLDNYRGRPPRDSRSGYARRNAQSRKEAPDAKNTKGTSKTRAKKS
jgi:hypothetical protein